MQDLSLVPSEFLFEELKNRYDSIVLGYVLSKDQAREERDVWYDGGMVNCLGLASYVTNRIIDDIADQEDDDYGVQEQE